MKKWILKPGQENFAVVDGEMAGRKFQPGKVYSEIPEPEKERFEVWAPIPVDKRQTSKAKTVPKGTENKK